jgi:hypothetical protein
LKTLNAPYHGFLGLLGLTKFLIHLHLGSLKELDEHPNTWNRKLKFLVFPGAFKVFQPCCVYTYYSYLDSFCYEILQVSQKCVSAVAGAGAAGTQYFFC